MKYFCRSLSSKWIFTLLTCMALGVNLASAAPKNPKISGDALAKSSSEMVDVIIQYKADPGAAQASSIVNADGSLKRALHSIHANAARLPQSMLENLAKDPNINYISVDRPLAARQSVTIGGTTLTNAEYTTEPINAPQVWAQGYDGTGIGIAVIDSGINNVSDLSVKPGQPGGTRIVYNQNFVPDRNGNITPNANDVYGHGTHVAGLAAGNGNDSTGNHFFRTFFGSAPNANLINLRVLDRTGAGSDSEVIAAIEQAIALKSQYNIRIINLSLGRPIWESYTLDPLCQAAEQAYRAGIVVVVAAGNDGRDQIGRAHV